MRAVKTGRFVIIGASLAGGSAVAGLREDGFEGDITMIGAETRLPYSRPPLSKGYLRGEERFEDQLVNPAAFYTERHINLRLGVRATAIDPDGKKITLEGGETVPYDRLLVTTGGRNRTLSTPGGDLPGIFQLRTVEDCDRIRAEARPGRRAVIVGLGFIGSEVTASLRQMGVEVTAVEGHPVPLARVLGPEVGAVLAAIHREKGVELVLEDSIAAFEGEGRVKRVRTEEGPRSPVRFRGGRHRHRAQYGAARGGGREGRQRSARRRALPHFLVRRLCGGRRGQSPPPSLRAAAGGALEQRLPAGARGRPRHAG